MLSKIFTLSLDTLLYFISVRIIYTVIVNTLGKEVL